jgi:hypothetical protein
MRRKHILDAQDIDEFDEINGDHQCVSIWCRTCKRYEFRSVHISDIGNDEPIVSTVGELIPFVGNKP